MQGFLKLLISSMAFLYTAACFTQPDFDNIEIQTLQVRDNIYILVGAGGNITVQLGNVNWPKDNRFSNVRFWPKVDLFSCQLKINRALLFSLLLSTQTLT